MSFAAHRRLFPEMFHWPARSRWPYIWLAAFSVMAALFILDHTPWRDELLHWTIVVHSDSLPDMVHNLRYEGHPVLWHTLLYPLTRITEDPAAMQFLNLAISILAAGLILKHAPFPPLFRILLVFGYIFFFEFTVISRAYMLGFLFMVISVLIYSRHGRSKPFRFALATGALANTSGHGMIIACSLWLLFGIEWLRSHRSVTTTNQSLSISFTAALLFAALVLIALACMYPAADGTSVQTASGFDSIRLIRQLRHAGEGFIALPAFWKPDFWNHSFLYWSTPILAVTSGLVLFSMFISLRKDRPILLALLAGVLTTLVLQYITGLRAMRYFSHYTILWLALAWVYASRFPFSHPGTCHGRTQTHRFFTTFLLVMCLLQTGSLIASLARQSTQDFTQSRNVANWLRQNNYLDIPHYGYIDFSVLAIASWTGRPIWVPESSRQLHHPVWNTKRESPLPKGHAILRCLRHFSDSTNQKSALIISHPQKRLAWETHYWTTRYTSELGLDITSRTSFIAPTTVADEQYTVYILDKRLGIQ